MDHFKGITPQERYHNELLQTQRDILQELKAIRELLGRDSKTVKQEPRTYQRKGVAK